MNGVLNLYFPCKLKNLQSLKKLNRKWERRDVSDTKHIHKSNRPLTDKIFVSSYIQRIESLLVDFKKGLGGYSYPYNEPHALKCIQQAYSQMHNDYVFSKNASVIIDQSKITYCTQKKKEEEVCTDTKNNVQESKIVDSLLLLNVNAENRIATFILCLRFENYTVDDCVYLKHVAFKNCKIEVHPITQNKDNCPCKECKINKTTKLDIFTIRDYVNLFSPFSSKQLDGDIDFRCRYSYLEIDKKFRKADIIHALTNADEGYNEHPNFHLNDRVQIIHPYRSFYKLYISNCHVLLMNEGYSRNRFCYEKPKLTYIDTNEKSSPQCRVAGISIKEQFPTFLKAVEIHYMVNSENTNEMGARDRSFINPMKFIRRAMRIWDILYEVDTNKYYINEDFFVNFGVRRILDDLRHEFRDITSLATGYAAIVIAFITLIFQIISLWN